ncbi:MAG: alpha/beta hydrolase [Erysipelotrichaceae bacterium]|nr:alpha/beta hydrolase [Erysipelotrichaceae bacterium]
MKLKKTAAIVGGTAGASYLTYQAISDHMFKRAFNKKKDRDIPVDEKVQTWLDLSVRKTINRVSFDGLKLYGEDIHNHDSNRYMIFVHGIWGDKRFSYPRAYEFDKLGYNVLVIDQRAAGNSEGKYYTYGFKESMDLSLWIDYLVNTYPGVQICLYGVSMGAATVMLSTRNGLPENVKCIVEDCGFSSMEEQFDCVLREDYNLFFTKAILKMLDDRMGNEFGFHFKDVVVKEVLDGNEIPILFIHGEEDKFVPFEMSLRLYNHNKGPKKYYPVSGLAHTEANQDPDYYKNVDEFIKTYL